MKLHRIYCDLADCTAKPVSADVVQLDDKPFILHRDGSLRPVDADTLWSGDRYITTAWHDSEAAAYAEAADELARRAQAVAALQLTCRAAAEVVHA